MPKRSFFKSRERYEKDKQDKTIRRRSARRETLKRLEPLIVQAEVNSLTAETLSIRTEREIPTVKQIRDYNAIPQDKLR